jgi:hypothetical protein
VNLQKFVSEALQQIALGANDAAEAVLKAGAAVNPRTKSSVLGEQFLGYSSQDHLVIRVDFDVAVVVSSEGSIGGEGGLQVAGLKFGGSGKQTDAEQSTSRIRFVVPLGLGHDPATAKARELQEREKQARIRADNPGWQA